MGDPKDLAYLLVFFLWAVYHSIKYIKNRISGKTDKLKKSNEFSIALEPVLWETLLAYGGIRLMVFDFGNGDKNYSGEPIQKMTVNHEVALPGIKRMRQRIQNVVVNTTMHKIMSKLRIEGDLYIKSIDDLEGIENHELKEGMQIYKCKSLYACPIYNEERTKIVAVVFVNFNFASPLNNIQRKELKSDLSIVQGIYNSYWG